MHQSVLLSEIVEYLRPSRDDGTLVDATIGLGGHAEALLDRYPSIRLLGIDRDPQALAASAQRLERFGNRVTLAQGRHETLIDILKKQKIESVSGLLADHGVLYELDGDVYQARSADPRFGTVSGLDNDAMAELFAERGGDPGRPGKKDPLDPLVWLAARPGEPSWPSGFGPGRPGWHVECAAIATEYLGVRFDIQAGGRYSKNEQVATESLSGLLVPTPISFSTPSSGHVWTYSAAPRWHIDSDNMVYFRWATGFRPGGPNALPPGAPPDVPRQFGADKTSNFELGLKSTLLQGQLSIDAALFHVDWTNIQLLEIVNGNGVNGNGSKARSQGFEWALGVYVIALTLFVASSARRQFKNVPLTNPLYGIWKVDEFSADGQVRPPLLSDNLRWQRIIFDSENSTTSGVLWVVTIQEMNGQFSLYVAQIGTHGNTFSLRTAEPNLYTSWTFTSAMDPRGQNRNADLSYNRTQPDTLILEGLMNGHRLRVTLKKEERQFVLETREFRWINDDFYANFYHK